MADAAESVNKDMKVFVVDSQAFPPQVSVRRDGPRLSVIYLLLAVALLGVFIEAGFIMHLYNRPATTSDIPNREYRKGEKYSFARGSNDFNEALPAKPLKAQSKPAAFLKIASPASGGNSVLRWRTDSFPVFMSGLEYKNNSLHVQQDGHYYIFSKIAHLEKCNYFKHQVMQCTDRYNSKAIELMQSSRFICGASESSWMGNSYLGGVFQLSKGDSVFVRVNNSSQVHSDANENFFGAFMV